MSHLGHHREVSTLCGEDHRDPGYLLLDSHNGPVLTVSRLCTGQTLMWICTRSLLEDMLTR